MAQMTYKVGDRTFDLEFEPDSAYLVDAPVGCSACDNGVQPGHTACIQTDKEILAEIDEGRLTRQYEDREWRVYISKDIYDEMVRQFRIISR